MATGMRTAASLRAGVLTRPREVRRALTVADVLPAPASVLALPGVAFTIPDGVRIVTTDEPQAVRVGAHLATLIGGSAPRPGDQRPPGGIALLVDAAYEPEEYALDIDRDGVGIRASGAAGLFWGVQTLRQLLPVRGPLVVPGVRIADRPRFGYRGVMLDVARHFFDVATVQRIIDLASRYKLNHLHLHLSDDQGWRIAIDSWPRLATHAGATEVGGGRGGYYTPRDYAQIVAYAQERFMTVVPEIDLPGHTNAALAAYPELAYDCVVPRRYTGTTVGWSALCPGRELTAKFLTDVLGEVAAMTPGPYLHVGGDEALTMSAHAYATIVAQAQQIVAAHGKVPVGWHELAGAPLGSTTVLQFWGVTPWARRVAEATKAGHRVIMSPADRTYLDQRHNLASRVGRTWAGPISAERAYAWDPARYLAGVPESAILGVEAPLWTEKVSTVNQIEYLMFPRLASIAEIGWSPLATHDWSAFRHRLGAQAPAWEALGVHFARVPGVPWVASPSAPALVRQRPGRRSPEVAGPSSDTDQAADHVPDEVVGEAERQRGKEPVPPEETGLTEVDAVHRQSHDQHQDRVPGEQA
jgi:hexosaminidase